MRALVPGEGRGVGEVAHGRPTGVAEQVARRLRPSPVGLPAPPHSHTWTHATKMTADVLYAPDSGLLHARVPVPTLALVHWEPQCTVFVWCVARACRQKHVQVKIDAAMAEARAKTQKNDKKGAFPQAQWHVCGARVCGPLLRTSRQ